MLISIPPKYPTSHVIGYIKGKGAIDIARKNCGRGKNLTGQYFLAKGSYASTVSRDEEAIRKYIREQEVWDKRLDQLNPFN